MATERPSQHEQVNRTEFHDLFSGHAACYARHRPGYPKELFSYVAGFAPARLLAWDVGTGNGQAAVGLADHFERVIATDASPKQLEHATRHPRIEYRVSTSEEAELPAGGVDVVAIAQALHWFRFDDFYANVRRVARPGGVIAAWCYTLPRVTTEVDAVCDWFYQEIVDPYWEAGRKWIDARYETIPFPFEEIRPTPEFHCRADWTMADYMNYIESWSAVQGHRKQVGTDPLQLLLPKLTAAWGAPEQRRLVAWPIHMRVGRIA